MLCKWDASIITLLLRIITSLLRRPLLLPIITHFSLPILQMTSINAAAVQHPGDVMRTRKEAEGPTRRSHGKGVY